MSDSDPPAASAGARSVLPEINELSDSELTREFDSLARLAFVLCGDSARAEDAAAETIAKVWQRFREGGIENLRPYLRRTLVNLLARGGRRASSEQRAVASSQRLERVEPSVADVVVDRTDLRVALDGLPPKQSAVLALRYFEDLSDTDIAVTLQIRLGTVKSRASRGLATLRGVLGGQDDV